jgi:hypothetical protein
MTRLPRIDGKTEAAVLARLGFEVARVMVSHYFLRHPDGRSASLSTIEYGGPGLTQTEHGGNVGSGISIRAEKKPAYRAAD